MSEQQRTRVLVVDDEPNVLEAIARYLRRSYDVTTATGGAAGLEQIQRQEPFAIIVSDLQMPHVDGVRLLSYARQATPDTIRILLTGKADLESAIGAVNQGAIFRFLTKPCGADDLLRALSAAEAQYRLVTAERVLLEQTLHGSIHALTDILALVHPAAFGRAARAKQRVSDLAEQVGLSSRWQVEVAAMLSQVGAVTLPAETVDKMYRGDALTHAETVSAERLPLIAGDVLAKIPRMEEVRDILTAQNFRFDGKGAVKGASRGKDIPLGARLLKIILDLDVLESRGMVPLHAIRAMEERTGWYDPDLLRVFLEMFESTTRAQQRVVEVELRSIRSGMVFAEDVKSPSGMLLVARGQEVSERLVERIRNLSHLTAGQQMVKVVVGAPAGSAERSPQPAALAAAV